MPAVEEVKGGAEAMVMGGRTGGAVQVVENEGLRRFASWLTEMVVNVDAAGEWGWSGGNQPPVTDVDGDDDDDEDDDDD